MEILIALTSIYWHIPSQKIAQIRLACGGGLSVWYQIVGLRVSVKRGLKTDIANLINFD